MKAQKQSDTTPEIAIRSCLHRLGFRFRVNAKTIPESRSRGDIVFPRDRLVVFVDGCFWHGCPLHATFPKANGGWWLKKLTANRERDERVDAMLSSAGWTVIRIWEHESPEKAAKAIARVLHRLRKRP